MKPSCSVPSCDRQSKKGGLCGAHYERLRRHGDLVDDMPIGGGKNLDAETRFWRSVEVVVGSCWLWQRSLADGYGRFEIVVDGKRRSVNAHRFAYELLVGRIPEGLELDHLCRVRHCVNPAHLEPVTHTENMRRGNGWAGLHARQTHCVNGHLFDEANTGRDSKSGARVCRACAREAQARSKRRRSA